MKHHFAHFSRIRVTLLSTALVLAACTEEAKDKKKDEAKGKHAAGDVQQNHGAAQQGAFSLTVPEEAAGLLDKLTIKILSQNGDPVSEQTQDVKGGESLSFPLDVGSYKVAIDAFLGGVLMFTGSGATDIKVGEKSLLDVTMVAADGAKQDGKGELEIHLKIPGLGDDKADEDKADEDKADEDKGGEDKADDDKESGDGDQAGEDKENGDVPANDEPVAGSPEEPGKPGDAGEDQPADDDDSGDVQSIVGSWVTDYSVDGCHHVTVKADDAGSMVFTDDSGRSTNAEITVKYKFKAGVLFISDMKSDNENRHLARVVRKNIGRSIDVKKKDGGLAAEILLPSGFIRVKNFSKAE